MQQDADRETRFMAIVSDNRRMIYKVCYMYASDSEHLNDLYQEVLANLWEGLDSFRGESGLSTWLYRVAINTCVSDFRHNGRHACDKVGLEALADEPCEDDGHYLRLHRMYRLISCLDRMDKAIILMWLDEKSYDEIAAMTSLPRNTVATRLHRIKQKLIERNKKEEGLL